MGVSDAHHASIGNEHEKSGGEIQQAERREPGV